MSVVFISYRRDDSEGEARALHIELAQVLGKNSVFMDVDSMALGRDFREALQERLASCDVMLALIGRDWLDARDKGGNRRLDNPQDYVRQEIGAALHRTIPVIPILVQGAQIPDQEQLPEELKNLVYRNAFELSHARWESDVRELTRRLDLRADIGRSAVEGRRRPLAAVPSWRRRAAQSAVILFLASALLMLWIGRTKWVRSTPKSETAPKSSPSTAASRTADTSSPSTAASKTAAASPASTDAASDSATVQVGYQLGDYEYSDILLEIDVGVNQRGASKGTLDKKLLFNAPSDGNKVKLPREALNGKVLQIATVVTTYSKETTVRYRLTGGVRDLTWTVSTPVNSEGDSRLFRTSVKFTR